MESNRCHWPSNTPGSTGARDGAISGFSEEVPARNPAAKSLRWRLGFCPNYHATLFSESFLFLRNSRVAQGCDFLCNHHYCKSSKYFKSLYLQGRESESQLLVWVLTHGQAIVGPLRSAWVQPSWGHTRSSSQNPEQSLTRFSPLQGIFPVLFAVAQTPQLIYAHGLVHLQVTVNRGPTVCLGISGKLGNCAQVPMCVTALTIWTKWCWQSAISTF